MYPTATQAYGYQRMTDAVYMTGGSPLRGLAGARLGLGLATPDGVMDAVTVRAGLGAGAAIGMAGAALYGGVIGGVAGQSWQTAGTGALAAAALSGIPTGVGLAMLGQPVPAAIALGLGAGAAWWAYKRTWGK